MESLGPECTKLKQKYEACFYKWYSEKYLTGKSKEDECAPLFKEYRDCLEVKEEVITITITIVILIVFVEIFKGKED
jgi:hypothetical protein